MRSSSRIRASLSNSCLVNFIFNLAYFFLKAEISERFVHARCQAVVLERMHRLLSRDCFRCIGRSLGDGFGVGGSIRHGVIEA